jgi:hypothetical protein
MTDQNIETTETNEEVKDEKVVTPETKQVAPKTFEQAEVDKIVKNRVASKNQEITSLKTTYEATITEKDTQIETLEKALSGMIASMTDGLSEGEKKLLAKLSVFDQLEYINETVKTEKKSNAKIIPTPKPTGENNKFTPKQSNFKL